jgi:anti-sigma B factor antagonist
MKINSQKNGTELTVFMVGSLDATAAPELEHELNAQWEGVAELVLDFTDVSFISSAGIRIILWARKQMDSRGKMTLKNTNENVREIFEMVGLTNELNFA